KPEPQPAKAGGGSVFFGFVSMCTPRCSGRFNFSRCYPLTSLHSFSRHSVMAQQVNALINDLMEQVLFLVSQPILNAEEPDQAAVDQLCGEVRQNIWHLLSERLELGGNELNEHLSKAI